MRACARTRRTSRSSYRRANTSNSRWTSAWSSRRSSRPRTTCKPNGRGSVSNSTCRRLPKTRCPRKSTGGSRTPTSGIGREIRIRTTSCRSNRATRSTAGTTTTGTTRRTTSCTWSTSRPRIRPTPIDRPRGGETELRERRVHHLHLPVRGVGVPHRLVDELGRLECSSVSTDGCVLGSESAFLRSAIYWNDHAEPAPCEAGDFRNDVPEHVHEHHPAIYRHVVRPGSNGQPDVQVGLG